MFGDYDNSFFTNFFNNYNLRFLVRIRQDALINNEFQDFKDLALI